MSEEIETPVAPVEEKSSGSVIPGVIGAAGGGYAAYHFGGKKIVNNGIQAALEGKEAPEGVKKAVDGVLSKAASPEFTKRQLDAHALNTTANGAEVEKVLFRQQPDKTYSMYLKNKTATQGIRIDGIKKLPDGVEAGKMIKEESVISKLFEGEKSFVKTTAEDILSEAKIGKLPSQKSAIDALKAGVENHTTVTSAEFKKVGEQHQLHFEANGAPHVVDLKKFPDGHVEGAVAADKIEALFKGDKAPIKGIVKEGEKELLNGIKSAEKIGFKSLETSGKAKVIGLAVGGVAVGYGVLNALFGGKHRQAAIQRTADASVEQGQARA